MYPKKKPGYDPEKILTELCTAVSELYMRGQTLRQIGEAFDMAPLKVRKLFVTARVYESEIAEEVNELYKGGRPIVEITLLTGLSRAFVHSYLPYLKIPYKADEISATAERIRKYRERK